MKKSFLYLKWENKQSNICGKIYVDLIRLLKQFLKRRLVSYYFEKNSFLFIEIYLSQSPSTLDCKKRFFTKYKRDLARRISYRPLTPYSYLYIVLPVLLWQYPYACILKSISLWLHPYIYNLYHWPYTLIIGLWDLYSLVCLNSFARLSDPVSVDACRTKKIELHFCMNVW